MRDRIHAPLDTVRGIATRLDGNDADYDQLLELTRDRQLVLLGEASHGTREFYRMRAEITRRLITEQGFEAVAVEADWPDAWRVNLCALHPEGEEPETSLDDFQRFLRWMWRNAEVLHFVHWLREWNAGQPRLARAGFYGLDLYSLYRSAEAVIEYLEPIDPEQAQIAQRRYACLDHVADAQAYGYQATFGLRPDCRDQVIRQIVSLRQRAPLYLAHDGVEAGERQFYAERNAAVVGNAEQYYRAMFSSRVNSWNVRDEHMGETLLALCAHLRARGGKGRVLVWAHNSHLGDARATDMGRAGELNLGQLARQSLGRDRVALVGFTTYTGHVAAAPDWDAEVERFAVRPALEGSYEELFRRSHLDRFYLPLAGEAAATLNPALLERAIGVVYRPQSERHSHYFHASLPSQFDAVFHLDETDAVEPLDAPSSWPESAPREADETWPFGV